MGRIAQAYSARLAQQGTIGAERPISLQDLFPLTSSFGREHPTTMGKAFFAPELIGRAGLDVLNLPFGVSRGALEAGRVMEEQGRIPSIGEAARLGFRPPVHSPEEEAVATLASTALAQPIFGAIGQGLSNIRRAAMTRGLITPEVLTPRVRPAIPRPAPTFQEAELVEPPRALPAPTETPPLEEPTDIDERLALLKDRFSTPAERAASDQELESMIEGQGLSPRERAEIEQMKERAKQLVPGTSPSSQELERSFDLPTRARTTPLSGMVRARQQAITAVQRDLLEQSKILNQESLSLRQRVLQAGGIKPTVGGQLREELSAIRPFLRAKGQPIDELATELGFEDGEALRQALIVSRQAKLPTIRELRAEAEQIVNSQAANPLLEAIQQPKIAQASITRLVNDLTTQAETTFAQGMRLARQLVRAGDRARLTPTQLARVARLYRETPLETTTGPRGGKQQAALSAADVQQIQERMAGLVPSGLTPAQRERIVSRMGDPERAFLGPGIPTGTGGPPKIPTTTALVPRDIPPPGSLRDIPRLQNHALSRVDPSRLAEFADQKSNGWVHRTFIDAFIEQDEKRGKFIQQEIDTLRPMAQAVGAKPSNEVSAKLQRAAEGRLRPNESMSPQEQALVEEIRRRYNTYWELGNKALQSIGKPPMGYITNYAPHFNEVSLLNSIFGGLENIPPVLLKTPFLRDIVQTPVLSRVTQFKDIPEDILLQLPFIDPKAPFFKHAMTRMGGPFVDDLLKGYEGYTNALARLIHITPYLNQAKPMLRFTPPNLQIYLDQLIHEQVGRPARFDKAFEFSEPLVNMAQQMARFQILGVTGENLRILVKQPDIIAAILAHNGPIATVRGALRVLEPSGSGRAFAITHSPEVALRVRRRILDPLVGRSRLERIGGQWVSQVDITMSSIAFHAGIEKAKMQGITDWETMRALGNRSVLRTHQSLRNFLRSNAMRSQVWRSTVGFLQAFMDNSRNILWWDSLRSQVKVPWWEQATEEEVRRGNLHAMMAFLSSTAAFLTVGEVFKQLNLPRGYPAFSDVVEGKPDYFIELLPGHLGRPIQEAAELATGRPLQTRFGIASMVGLAFKVPIELLILSQHPQNKKVQGNFDRDMQTLLSSFIPFGTQIKNSVIGVEAATRGAGYSGDNLVRWTRQLGFEPRGKFQFPISGAMEKIWAALFGKYQTRAGQAYLERKLRR